MLSVIFAPTATAVPPAPLLLSQHLVKKIYPAIRRPGPPYPRGTGLVALQSGAAVIVDVRSTRHMMRFMSRVAVSIPLFRSKATSTICPSRKTSGSSPTVPDKMNTQRPCGVRSDQHGIQMSRPSWVDFKPGWRLVYPLNHEDGKQVEGNMSTRRYCLPVSACTCSPITFYW